MACAWDNVKRRTRDQRGGGLHQIGGARSSRIPCDHKGWQVQRSGGGGLVCRDKRVASCDMALRGRIDHHLPPQRQIRRGAEGGGEPPLHHRVGDVCQPACLHGGNARFPAFSSAQPDGRV